MAVKAVASIAFYSNTMTSITADIKQITKENHHGRTVRQIAESEAGCRMAWNVRSVVGTEPFQGGRYPVHQIVLAPWAGIGWLAVERWYEGEYKHVASFRSTDEAAAFIERLEDT